MQRFLSFRVLASIGVVLLALAVTAPRTQSQAGVTEATTGLAATSNGFAEEFCGSGQFRQDRVTDSPNSPRIPADECSFGTASKSSGARKPRLTARTGSTTTGAGRAISTRTRQLEPDHQRVSFFNGQVFTDHAGGSLIQDRGLDPDFIETVTDPRVNVVAFRSSLNVAGDGYVEAIGNGTLQDIADGQPQGIRGQVTSVDVAERPGAKRTGRFGWKGQQASMVSFGADAYVNEMGITSPLQPNENTVNGRRVGQRDTVPPGHADDAAFTDNNGVDVELFALFMRSLPAPARASRISQNAQAGSNVFDNIGCDNCRCGRS
jgi:hypothetical protein